VGALDAEWKKGFAGINAGALLYPWVGDLGHTCAAYATCGEEYDGRYSSAIDRLQYGDDPADADDLAGCIRETRDDYRSCLDDCASAAISLTGRRILVAAAHTMPVTSLYRDSAHY
jgi:hypothetical protein